jgi:succinate dehydrogenase/fumarate reductase flavoprotein subunit
VRRLRSNQTSTIRARNVIVATGGFGSNLSMVLKNWPHGEPKPPRLLLGAAHTATGSGHDMVIQAGGNLQRMDHQWSYVLGLPDPRDPAGARGLAAFNFSGIWVNQNGNRFTQEFGDPKTTLAALLRQPGASYWTVFDEKGKGGFSITLAGWDNFKDVSKIAYETEGVTISANSISELATKMGVPPAALEKTVARYNELTGTGIDSDFQAFGLRTSPKPNPISVPPFYATRFFPITRKSMGGVSVNMDCRVLTREGKPISNLFAIGEVTGFGGINGKAALEGTFLGPAAFMGRIAGRLVSPKAKTSAEVPLRPAPKSFPPGSFSNSECLGCHELSVLQENRKGYWHFEQSHRKVRDRNYACASCHDTMFPYDPKAHKLDLLGQTLNCEACHGIQSTRASIEP